MKSNFKMYQDKLPMYLLLGIDENGKLTGGFRSDKHPNVEKGHAVVFKRIELDVFPQPQNKPDEISQACQVSKGVAVVYKANGKLPKQVHPDKDTAYLEASRLATLFTSEKFAVYECVYVSEAAKDPVKQVAKPTRKRVRLIGDS